MKHLHFYGDSWTIESDCENAIKNCVGYPSMVGKILGVGVSNHAMRGNSQMGMVDQLVRSNIFSGDHAIFSMSASSRRFYFNEQGQSINIPVDKNLDSINDYQDSWLSASTCQLLISICKDKRCRPWFVNLFNVSYQKEWAHPLWNFLPQNFWMLAPDRCLVQEIFDPEWFSKFAVFRNSDFHDWLENNNQQVEKYIRPCHKHPNLEGRHQIAMFIAEKLKSFVSGEKQ